MADHPPLSRRNLLKAGVAAAGMLLGRGAAADSRYITPEATLMLMGGRDRDDKVEDWHALLQKMIEVSRNISGKEHPVIECITSADQNAPRAHVEGEFLIGQLKEFGASEKTHYIHLTESGDFNNDEIIKRIENADVVFFDGGDQETLVRRFMGTAAYRELKAKYITDPKFLIAGTSAGAMAMSHTMINGGDVPEKAPKKFVYEPLMKGFRFLECLVDTHVGVRGRAGRLELASEFMRRKGIGLDTYTALVIRKDNARVFAPPSPASEEPRYVRIVNPQATDPDKRWSYYHSGQEFKLKDHLPIDLIMQSVPPPDIAR